MTGFYYYYKNKSSFFQGLFTITQVCQAQEIVAMAKKVFRLPPITFAKVWRRFVSLSTDGL